MFAGGFVCRMACPRAQASLRTVDCAETAPLQRIERVWSDPRRLGNKQQTRSPSRPSKSFVKMILT